MTHPPGADGLHYRCTVHAAEEEREVAHWSLVWAESGAGGLSGRAEGPPLDVPVSLVRCASEAAASIRGLSARLGREVLLDGPALFGERAALAGLTRGGDVSCGGATRLLRTADGWLAASLAREADVESIPAWLQSDIDIRADRDDVWTAVADVVGRRAVADLVAQAALLGMPVSRLGEVGPPSAPVTSRRSAGDADVRPLSDLVAVDLSSLWAGPLCANVLGLAGARVVKVESEHRPDGARAGEPRFFDLLHAGHESVCLDLRSKAGRGTLQRLVQGADVVIEASRPRALAQLGVNADDRNGPRIWLSITSHGVDGAAADRVGFGDDAAVAGGLVTRDADGPCFLADAVADPLTGLVAAGAVLTALASGGRWRLDAALARSAACVASGPRSRLDGLALAPPRARVTGGSAPALGAHTDEILRERDRVRTRDPSPKPR
ncbi:MAG: L-carnitine dehydratase/bile acid-inducible protein [Ilumatobacteraceae bacterium]|nr:L-carnitine dehydratase/bile acid-inducible protein [Ilumatobacteraceae bacterium]